jgi:4a-hydroxytetrahydrobiopterin dehydratase
VALLAEASRHHPEIDVRHGTVRLALTTAEAGGVTARDTDLADWIERVVP